MASRSAKLEPRSPPKYQKDTNMYSKFPKCRRDCHTRASRSLTMLQKHHQATQSGTYALGKSPRCKKTRTNRLRPGARRRRRRSGRGFEGRAHQAASRSPRSGAEAGIRGTSSKISVQNKYRGCRPCRRLFLTFPIALFWVPGGPQNTSKKQRPPMVAQRVKTRGPTP